ncbi:hypothetical protein GPJ56_007492 [Histomonas meleagridis]|uniref:uncharacterized protein n=1 Tax=Histomonas meleagridis TaxID=135588 RepID=UPI00355A6C07|nr:hypothetical protein GPJ56_007492 [Histomonas meleagridis]KAH0804338.1 hypothetical protein GO595_003168 [Histomonas meleagridis]
MSPILYTRDQNTKVPSYCCINEQGDFVILDNSPDNNQLDKFNQTVYTGMMEDEKLLFYKDDNNPVIELIFPTSDNASDAFIFSLTPPEPGFMELISFLHSFQAFKNKKLLNSEFPSQLPKIFKTEIQKCIESSSMELLFYAFSISQKNTKINERNIKFFISALGDKLMPFIRALLHMNWCEEPFGGHIILRHDSPLSSLLRMLLKFYCEDYIKYMMTEIKKIIDESDEFIHEMPISNEEDAMTFIQKVFYREIDTLFDSVDTKMSSLLRSVIRAVFIRTAGFYINQHAPYLTIPNLMLLRYILPPITTTITLSYQSGSKSQAISKLASSSFLSLFYRNGWTSDPFLSKYSKYMEKYYQKSVEFAIHVIDCHDYQFDNPKIYLDDQWDMIDLLSDAADNLIFNDMKSPNKILDTHIYSISIMQMIEEYAYDFSIVPK